MIGRPSLNVCFVGRGRGRARRSPKISASVSAISLIPGSRNPALKPPLRDVDERDPVEELQMFAVEAFVGCRHLFIRRLSSAPHRRSRCSPAA